MVKRMLIDAAHTEETRVAIMDDSTLLEYEGESFSKRPLKGNIYLAKIVRIEPSLQSAFVEYGGGRHGFLSFLEIHPDYFRIPVADLEKLLAADDRSDEASDEALDEGASTSTGAASDAEPSDDDTATKEARRHMRPKALHRSYKIQEVIHKNQIVLVQVVKEERGNKGASLTTYLSLPGRYCVLMPNALRTASISRKITAAKDRQRLRSIVEEFDLPSTMGAIVRTAGLERSKTEIKRDLSYLLKLWDQIRQETLVSVAPKLIYEEGDIIQRAMRDMYTHDMEEILIEGKDAYKKAKDLLKNLVPSHAKRVKNVSDQVPSVFHTYNVHRQVDAIYDSVVRLPSGGYLVMSTTEALIAIDVNSGKATKDRHIEETAFRTNMEAAEEVARQLRLRDMAGIVVIDFIDMSENRNIAAVERKFREAIKQDRARIQVGHISTFGLLELSRQRLRPSVSETASHRCDHCEGTGMVRSVESAALQAIRATETKASKLLSEGSLPGDASSMLILFVPRNVAYYLMNKKRQDIVNLETKYKISLDIQEDADLKSYHYRLLTLEKLQLVREDQDKALKLKFESIENAMNLTRPTEPRSKSQEVDRQNAGGTEDKEPNHRNRDPKRGQGGRLRDKPVDRLMDRPKTDLAPVVAPDETQDAAAPSADSSLSEGTKRRRSRNRRRDRHGRRRERVNAEDGAEGSVDASPKFAPQESQLFVVHEAQEAPASSRLVPVVDAGPVSDAQAEMAKNSRRRRSGRSRPNTANTGIEGAPAAPQPQTVDTAPQKKVAAQAKKQPVEKASQEGGPAAEVSAKAPRRRSAPKGAPKAANASETPATEAPSTEAPSTPAKAGRRGKGWLSRLLDA